MMARSLTPEFGKKRQEDLWEFEVCLVYRVRSRSARTIESNPISKQNKTEWVKPQTEEFRNI